MLIIISSKFDKENIMTEIIMNANRHGKLIFQINTFWIFEAIL
jgi:hypothetical protein